MLKIRKYIIFFNLKNKSSAKNLSKLKNLSSVIIAGGLVQGLDLLIRYF